MAETAVLADHLGNETIITPENGYYILDLAGTVCYEECLMGGPPMFLMEEDIGEQRIPDAPASIGNPTITPTPAESPTPTATGTPLPTETAVATETPIATETAVPTDTPQPTLTSTNTPAPTSTPVATEVAQMIVEATAAPSPPSASDSNVGFWFLGGAGLLVLLLVGVFIVQKRGDD